MGPKWLMRIPIHDFVTPVRMIVQGPSQRGVVRERTRIDGDILGRARRVGQRPQSGAVYSRNTCYEVKIDEFDEITELSAVFNANVLVLVVKILVRLGESDCCDSTLKEGDVIS